MEMYKDKMSPEMIKVAMDIEKHFSPLFHVVDHTEVKKDVGKLLEVGIDRFISSQKQE